MTGGLRCLPPKAGDRQICAILLSRPGVWIDVKIWIATVAFKKRTWLELIGTGATLVLQKSSQTLIFAAELLSYLDSFHTKFVAVLQVPMPA